MTLSATLKGRVSCKRHKWEWIVNGYARKCKVCGVKEYFHEKLKLDKDVQLIQGGFPVKC